MLPVVMLFCSYYVSGLIERALTLESDRLSYLTSCEVLCNLSNLPELIKCRKYCLSRMVATGLYAYFYCARSQDWMFLNVLNINIKFIPVIQV